MSEVRVYAYVWDGYLSQVAISDSSLFDHYERFIRNEVRVRYTYISLNVNYSQTLDDNEVREMLEDLGYLQ